MKKIANLPPLPDDLILCTIDVVALYLNIPHEEGLIDTRKDKTILTDSLIKLAVCSKNKIFQHDKSIFMQLKEIAIGTKMVMPPNAIIFMGSLERDTLSNSLLKSLV